MPVYFNTLEVVCDRLSSAGEGVEELCKLVCVVELQISSRRKGLCLAYTSSVRRFLLLPYLDDRRGSIIKHQHDHVRRYEKGFRDGSDPAGAEAVLINITR